MCVFSVLLVLKVAVTVSVILVFYVFLVLWCVFVARIYVVNNVVILLLQAQQWDENSVKKKNHSSVV
jgi:hypothetical protein